jgi:integrase
MKEKKHLIGEKSRSEYAAIVRNHIAPMFGNRDPRELTAKEIGIGMRGHMGKYGNPLASATKYRITYVLSIILGSLAENGTIPANPLLGTQPYSKAPEEPRSALPRPVLAKLFPEGHGSLMRVWQKTFWATLFCVIYDSGMRPVELRSLRWGDVHEGAAIVRRPKRGRKTKAGIAVGVVRAARLSERTMQELAIWKTETPYPSDSDLVFTLNGTDAVTDAGIVAAFRGGLRKIDEFRPEWTTYWLRHSFVTYALADLSPGEVAELAGHSVAIAEAVYSHPDDEVILARTSRARAKLDSTDKARAEEKLPVNG